MNDCKGNLGGTILREAPKIREPARFCYYLETSAIRLNRRVIEDRFRHNVLLEFFEFASI